MFPLHPRCTREIIVPRIRAFVSMQFYDRSEKHQDKSVQKGICSRLGKREARKVISEKELRIDIERTRYFLSNSRISGNFAGGANESSIYIRAYIRVYVYIYKYTYRASRTGHASYTLNSVRMSPNGEIVINLSVKIQTRPGFPNNLLRTRGARDAILSLFLFRLDSRIDSRANHPSDRNLARLSIASVPGEVADENVTSNDRKTGT